MLDEQVSGQHAHTPAASISAHVVRLLLSYDSDNSCSQSIMSGWRTPWLTAEGFESRVTRRTQPCILLALQNIWSDLHRWSCSTPRMQRQARRRPHSPLEDQGSGCRSLEVKD
jgi:hypothetical protein